MKKLFTNILVPVVRPENADVIIEEAVRIAHQLHCHIHVLYFMPPTGKSTGDLDQIRTNVQTRYQSRISPSFALTIHGQTGSIVNGVLEYCSRNGIDLVLFSRERPPFWSLIRGLWRRTRSMPVNILLKKINCPVLIIHGPLPAADLKNIVLPVGEGLPMRKLLFATYLAKLTHSTIHLVAATGKIDDQGEGSNENLQKSYRLLRENTDLSVQCRTMPGMNLADITWHYARRIKADLILVDPGKESRLSGFLNGLRSQYLDGVCSRSLLNVSRIPVMSVLS